VWFGYFLAYCQFSQFSVWYNDTVPNGVGIGKNKNTNQKNCSQYRKADFDYSYAG